MSLAGSQLPADWGCSKNPLTSRRKKRSEISAPLSLRYVFGKELIIEHGQECKDAGASNAKRCTERWSPSSPKRAGAPVHDLALRRKVTRGYVERRMAAPRGFPSLTVIGRSGWTSSGGVQAGGRARRLSAAAHPQCASLPLLSF